MNQFLRISWSDRWLLAEAITFLSLVRLASKLVPFKRLAPFLGEPASTPDIEINQSTEAFVKSIAWAIRIMAKYLPWTPSCLEKSMAAKRILQRRRIPSTLYLGVAKNNQNVLDAHAWLQCGPFIVTGETNHQHYINLISFTDHYD
ncbi:MAG: lasso peptide biosynthesis B2 protein [Brevefilum sp.]|nr:lasso peptide biosynthesis B2 protein [Brevefilum sp.]